MNWLKNQLHKTSLYFDLADRTQRQPPVLLWILLAIVLIVFVNAL